jgi:HAMP domain-containing protein
MSAALGVGAVLLMMFIGVCMGACVRTHWKNPNQPLRRLARAAQAIADMRRPHNP